MRNFKNLLNKNILTAITIAACSLTAVTVSSYAGKITRSHHKNSSTQAYNKISPITLKDVYNAQHEWASGLINIGKVYTNKGNYKKTASELIDQLYAYNYGKGTVLFKPTKAKYKPFRNTKDGALSYFVDHNKKFSEDKGFALAPWKKVVFHNNEIYLHGDIAIAMGEYFFTDTKGSITKAEFTFGYIKNKKGELKIVLHHSSFPFSG